MHPMMQFMWDAMPPWIALGVVFLMLPAPPVAKPAATQCELPRHVREVMRATRFIDSTGDQCFIHFYPADTLLDEVPVEQVQIACDE